MGRALGLDSEIGSIELGKSADLVALDLRDPHTQPLYHPVSQLVYAAGRHQVRQVIHDSAPTTLHLAEVLSKAQVWGARIGV
jgi:5-methylthioadenosine/S-adenosylhomocysteine deaminase